MLRATCLAAVITALAVVRGFAQDTRVNGAKEAEYGDALAVQTVETSFGDNLSELDAAYGRILGRRLYLLFTGNLAPNFDKLDIFIDSKPGGQSVFDSAGNDGAARMDGLAFDAGFTADYHLIATRGTDAGDPMFNLDYANLGTQNASHYIDTLTSGALEGDRGISALGANDFYIFVAYLDSNKAGVGGNAPNTANEAAALAVTTGFEFSIDLLDLGYGGGPIKLFAGLNRKDHAFWSNQFLPGLPAPQGSLGGDELGNFTGEGAIDLTHFAGNQYFIVPGVVPEPAAGVMAAMGILAAAVLRRRREVSR